MKFTFKKKKYKQRSWPFQGQLILLKAYVVLVQTFQESPHKLLVETKTNYKHIVYCKRSTLFYKITKRYTAKGLSNGFGKVGFR